MVASRALAFDTQRIEHLVSQSEINNTVITVIGLGSGGAPVVQQLAMSGFRRWRLFDPDYLDEVNLVKHPGLRSDLGKPKVEIVGDWIRDRNPTAETIMKQSDVFHDKGFEPAVKESDLVICAADNNGARDYVNSICVSNLVPCATGSVFRTGFGGEVYLYRPGVTGCYACMTHYANKRGFNIEDVPELTADEKRRIYGLGEKEYSASGLAIDISLVASLHAQMCFGLLAGKAGSPIPPLTFNWLVFGIRPQKGTFIHSRFEASRMLLRPQLTCLTCSQDTHQEDNGVCL
jgi:molybdopterin/thiamine biosynthesis adenylyltransferase